MKIADIESIGRNVLELLATYHNPPKKELLLDAILFAYLRARYAHVARQHRLYVSGFIPWSSNWRCAHLNSVVKCMAVKTKRS